jgi:hypothetical protein
MEYNDKSLREILQLQELGLAITKSRLIISTLERRRHVLTSGCKGVSLVMGFGVWLGCSLYTWFKIHKCSPDAGVINDGG